MVSRPMSPSVRGRSARHDHFCHIAGIQGTLKSGAPMKRGYTLPRAQMENADVARIINSTEARGSGGCQLWGLSPSGMFLRGPESGERVARTLARHYAFGVRVARGPAEDCPDVHGAIKSGFLGHEQFTTRAVSPHARMQRSRAEILLVMTWGSAACHLRPDIIGAAAKALVRRAKLILHLFRADSELDWHIPAPAGVPENNWRALGANNALLSSRRARGRGSALWSHDLTAPSTGG